MSDDAIFASEEKHLKNTYALLEQIKNEAQAQLESDLEEALANKEELFRELTRDYSSDIQLETLAELEALNRIIESQNLSADIKSEKLRRVQLLLKQPYFAKIELKFAHSESPKEIYIGASGMTDDKRRHFIIDWRSPIAEVYYNQANGATSYEANGRTIRVDLQLRRQFDIEKDKLKAYFDTSVAIEDPLLLKSLSTQKSSKLSAITTSIQKEQNKVIRHKDVPALLVHGIAGSGKTSVLLQRIAYLFYTERENLDPQDVYLITPNLVFGRYIDNVLPDMGESNPNILTWDTLMEEEGLEGRGIKKNLKLESLRQIDQALDTIKLEQNDLRDICIDGERVLSAASIRNSLEKFKNLPFGRRRNILAAEDMCEKLEQRITRLSKDEDEQDKLLELSNEEQVKIFGQIILPMSEEESVGRTREWLIYRYRKVWDMIEKGAWLRLDRIAMRLLGKESIDAAEILYLRLSLLGGGKRHARYVMIDEVQDYTLSQLAVLAQYYSNAHFLLLGDENQAVKPGTACFKEISELFKQSHGEIDTCSLMISYRSTPEITNLFCKLLPESERIEAQSVQRKGTDALIIESANGNEYIQSLRELVHKATQDNCLSALIANSTSRAKQLYEILKDEQICYVSSNDSLPAKGLILLDVKLAKGLEFEHVIVPDVQEGAFAQDKLHKHKLYTAISRATKRVSLIACGKLDKLLR